MNKLLLQIIFWGSVPLVCYNKREHDSGLIEVRERILDSKSGDFINPKYWKDRKIWFEDSCVIEESIKVNITKQNGKETVESKVDRYIYIDLRTKSFYEYAAFSETALLLKKYRQPDSAIVSGGWNFYWNRSLVNGNEMHQIADTFLRNQPFKRYQSIEITNQHDTAMITSYHLCSKKNSIFHYDRQFDEKIGCPMTRLEILKKDLEISIRSEYEFLSDHLTLKEQTVFDAWAKYAKLHPIP